MNLNELNSHRPLLQEANDKLAVLYSKNILSDDFSICFITDSLDIVSNKGMPGLKPYLTFSHDSNLSRTEVFEILNLYIPDDIMKNVRIPLKYVFTNY
jgi:hypothetical protein